jgi:hypothetical protein
VKVAIIGGHPYGLILGARLLEVGASVSVFGSDRPCASVFFERTHTPVATWANMVENAIAVLGKADCFITNDIKRIHKRHLRNYETPQSSSRMIDLFRVVYESRPSSLTSDEVSNIEAIDRNIVTHLSTAVELFKDYDFIVDARGSFFKRSFLGGCFPALGEDQSMEHLDPYWGENLEEAVASLQVSDGENIFVYGDSSLSATIIPLLWEKVLKPRDSKLILVSECQSPFSKVAPFLKDAVEKVRLENHELFENGKREYERALFEYRSLEPNEKQGVTTPVSPHSKLQGFWGYNISSVDYLTDREKAYLTLEKPSFRGSEELKTIAVDHLFIGDPVSAERDQLYHGMSGSEEPGWYILGEQNLNIDGIENVLEKTMEDMMTYFKKVEA